MRSLANRGIRPRLQSSNSSSLIPPIRRTPLAPFQKPLHHADTFLLLLPTLLATAFAPDTTRKDRRHIACDRHLVLAQEQAGHFRWSEPQATSNTARHSISNGVRQQRRFLWTASQIQDPSRTQDDQYVDEEREREMDPLKHENEINNADSSVDTAVDETTEENQNKHQRFGRLLATRLALQMMLKLRSGRSARYQPAATVDVHSTMFKQSMDYIVQELDKVLTLMHSIRVHEIPWDMKMPPMYLERQAEMAKRIQDMSHRYNDAEIHLPDYVLLFVQLVTEFKIGPPLRSYVLMMRTLGHNQQESPMANYVEKAIFDCHEYLDSYTISNIIYRYGSNLDSVRMNDFLNRLTRKDHHPRARSLWYRTHVNDIDVNIPKSKSGHLMTGLIRTALMNRQQTVAEAYGSIFLDRDRVERYSPAHKWFVVGNFLNGYGKWGSWKTGRRWLETAILWAPEFAQAENHILGRVILRMLDFCVACGKREDYESIIEAAIAASLPVPPIDPTKLIKISDRMNQIRVDWSKRTPKYGNFRHQHVTKTQIETFQSALKGRYDATQQLPKLPFHPADSDWSDQSVLGWNPLVAARRLTQASEQRQSTVNTGFKNFPSQKPKFPLSGPQNSLSQEPLDVESSFSEDASNFVSPFFQAIYNESSSNKEHVNKSGSFGDSENLELEKLREELSVANQRLQASEKQSQERINRLQQELMQMRSLLKQSETSILDHEENVPSRRTAATSG